MTIRHKDLPKMTGDDAPVVYARRLLEFAWRAESEVETGMLLTQAIMEGLRLGEEYAVDQANKAPATYADAESTAPIDSEERCGQCGERHGCHTADGDYCPGSALPNEVNTGQRFVPPVPRAEFQVGDHIECGHVRGEIVDHCIARLSYLVKGEDAPLVWITDMDMARRGKHIEPPAPEKSPLAKAEAHVRRVFGMGDATAQVYTEEHLSNEEQKRILAAMHERERLYGEDGCPITRTLHKAASVEVCGYCDGNGGGLMSGCRCPRCGG